MAIPQGRFVWHDLITTDVEGAKKFYTALIGWGTEPWDEDDNYTMWQNNGAAIGGVGRLENGAKSGPAWNPSVYVYDIDACVRQVPKIGGSVPKAPREIPNVGCWAEIAGPDGAPLGIFEPSQGPPPGHEGAARVGEFSWHELLSNDWKTSWQFYQPLFHWETMQEVPMERLGTYFIFGQKGEQYGGMFTRIPDMPPPNWTSYIEVKDVKEAAAKVKQLGGKVMREPHEVPGGTMITICEDPQGAMFAMTSRA